MFNIEVKTIPAHLMRYPSAGDYWEGKNGVTFAVVELGDWRYEALVAIHEIVEYVLVKAAGVAVADIDEFDIRFEKEREMGIHGPDDEPGDDTEAPYHLQHGIATAAERMVAAVLRVPWAEYDAAIAGVHFPSVKKMWKKRK